MVWTSPSSVVVDSRVNFLAALPEELQLAIFGVLVERDLCSLACSCTVARDLVYSHATDLWRGRLMRAGIKIDGSLLEGARDRHVRQAASDALLVDGGDLAALHGEEEERAALLGVGQSVAGAVVDRHLVQVGLGAAHLLGERGGGPW